MSAQPHEAEPSGPGLAQPAVDILPAAAPRKGKPQQNAASHHYDNDNLPTNEHLSVVGPPPPAANAATQSADTTTTQSQASQATKDANKKTADDDRKQSADDMKDKIDAQKKTVESLNHELDLVQREYRLRAAAMYSDAGNRLRNSAQWDKEEGDFKKQLEEKQKAVDAAKQDLENLQEQARKSGVRERE